MVHTDACSRKERATRLGKIQAKLGNIFFLLKNLIAIVCRKNASFYVRYFIMFVKISNVLRVIYLLHSSMWN